MFVCGSSSVCRHYQLPHLVDTQPGQLLTDLLEGHCLENKWPDRREGGGDGRIREGGVVQDISQYILCSRK